MGIGSHSGSPDGVVGVFLGCSGPVPGFTDTLQVPMIESHCLFLYCPGGETYIIITNKRNNSLIRDFIFVSKHIAFVDSCHLSAINVKKPLSRPFLSSYTPYNTCNMNTSIKCSVNEKHNKSIQY